MPGTFQIRRPAEFEALASPMRHSILQVAIIQKEASISEIATQLDCPASSLYRHIQVLVEAGLLVPSGIRKTSKRDAQTYRPPEERVVLRYMPEDEPCLAGLVSYAKALMRQATKELCASFLSKRAQTAGEHRDTHFMSASGWLDDEQLAEVNGHIASINTIINSSPRREGTRLQSVTVALRPMHAD